MSGVQIGDGAVIAAGAIVAENVAPYAIYAGVPAKRIKYRFSPDLITQIIDSQWWQYANPDLANLPIWQPETCIEILSKVKKVMLNNTKQ
jgi:virginiamycin A acetyltransferase